jgi:putative aldouronate transport system substrate-binding protein
MTSLRDQGALAPLEDMVSKADKLMAEITPKIYEKNFMNGHLYGIPAAFYYSGTGGVIWREDLRQKYNAPAPTSKEGWPSLEPYLKAIADNEKGMMPFANVTTQSITGYSRSVHQWPAGLSKVGVTVLEAIKGPWTFANMEDDDVWFETVKLVNSWWQKGYINKTDLTFSGTSQNAQVDYIYPGKASACVENEPDYKYIDETKQMQSTNKTALLKGVDMRGEIDGVQKGIGTYVQWNFIVVNQAAPKDQQQGVVDYFNWLSTSQDNVDLWLMGIDGKNYKKESSGLTFSEIPGVDAARNYRRQWYVSGMGGRFQRQPVDLPADALAALKFFSTESNWQFNPYETFTPDSKALEVDMGKLTAVYDEAVHGMDTGQIDPATAKAQFTKMMDDAGRQTFKAKLQKQLDDFIAAHPAA